MNPAAIEAVDALLDQRRTQGFETPSEAVAQRLTQLLAGALMDAEAEPLKMAA